MSRYWKTAEYSQLSAEELRYKAEESMRKAEGKGRSMEPVTIEGRVITVSWWGKAWCENLENMQISHHGWSVESDMCVREL
ncbi:MAG: hypothetical protein ACLTDX_01365 [[Clostridium] innocuum]